MKTTLKNLSDTSIKATVTLDAADLAAAREEAVRRLGSRVKVPGFRAGKAPAAMIEKQIPTNELANTTVDIAVRKAVPEAFKNAKQPPLAITEVKVIEFIPGESAEFTAEAEFIPEVKVGDYQKLSAKMDDVEPKDSDVEDILNHIREGAAETTAVKRATALGDEVVIDFVGKRKNGEAFAGGSAKDHKLRLGSGQFIPGFEDAVVGHEAGDKFDIKISFPKDYMEKSLAGQPVVFETLLKQVNEVKLPELNDDFAAQHNFKTVDELREDIRKNLRQQNTYVAGEKYREELIAELVKKSKVSAPEVLVRDQLNSIRADERRNAAMRGLSLEDHLASRGQTLEDFEKDIRALAEARVKSSLVLQIFARDHGIAASDEEVDVKIAELRDLYHNSKEALTNLRRPDVRQEIKNRLIIDKTVDFIAEANQGKPTKQGKSAKK